MPQREADTAEYIAARIEKDDAGCWNWTLSLNPRGYGLCFRRDWRGLAHRFAYARLVGEIPEGVEIDHLCMNKACVNPDHLEVVTSKTNAQRERRARFGRNYSIYQTASGLWCATAERRTSNGARRRKSFRSKTRADAVAKIEGWLGRSQQPLAGRTQR